MGCKALRPGRVHTPFVDGFIAKNYAGREAEMFEKLSKAQPIGRMTQPEEMAHAPSSSAATKPPLSPE
jgi:2-keto-3-deoxy-L-fuconate dehydrogenase